MFTRKGSKLIGAAVAATLGSAALAAPSTDFFLWNSTPAMPSTPYSAAAPDLNNTNYVQVGSYLSSLPAGATMAVSVNTPLTAPGAIELFRKYPIKYVFGDYEQGAVLTQVRTLATSLPNNSQVRVGNYGLAPLPTDPTKPNPNGGYTQSQYAWSQVKMANEELYPGSPGFRNPAAGNSTAPNIRSALFTMPIQRASLVTQNLPQGSEHIPYVTRFNNWGNSALDTDGNPNQGTHAKFEFVQNAANPADGQLLSRGDFSAQVLHERMRGATSLVMFCETGVVDYTMDQMLADAHAGWNLGGPKALFENTKNKLATLSSEVTVDGDRLSTEDAGVVWSGVYVNDTPSQSRLEILLSNMDSRAHEVKFDDVATYAVIDGTDNEFSVAAGTHRLLSFNLVKSKNDRNNQLVWKLFEDERVFTDDFRNGVGIPEPTSAGMLLVGVAGGLLRRRRRTSRKD
jgi:hypothetical protein